MTVTITVTAVNRAPLAANDAYSMTKNSVLNVPAPGVLGNDIDQDGNVLSIASVMSQPSHGSLHMNLDGSFVYLPTTNYAGLDSFTYTVSDGAAVSNVATVVIDVRDANFPPIAHDDRYTTPAGTALSVLGPGLLANDSDPDGNQPLRVILASQPSQGILTLTTGGGFEYTPNLPATCSADASDSFTYYANDSVVNSNLATVTIAIHCTNRAPVGNADSYTVPQGGQLTIPPKGVLVNDTDADGNSLSLVLVSSTSQGPLAVNPDGRFSYRAPNAAGTDSFTYRATDGGLESAPTTVTITVTAVNRAPLAANDAYSTTKNSVLSVPAPGVLGNDIDQDGNVLSIASVMSQPSHGTLHLDPDGRFTYTPTANYVGLDSFTYSITDGTLVSTPATVTIEVRNANFPPVAQNDSYTTPHNVALVLAAPGLLANDSDPDGNQPLRVVIASQPTKGTLGLGVGGGFTYTPAGGVCSADSTDSFTYYANDSVVNSNLATVTLTIHCVNRAPVANADGYTVQQGGQLAIPAPGLLINDSDPDGNTLSAILVTQPTRGALAFNPNGSFTYQAVIAGTDSFTYKVSDGALESVPVTVTINVTATNQLPLAANDLYQTVKNVPLMVNAPGVLSNDSDPDGNTLSLSSVMTQPSHGTLSAQANGSFTYTPSNNYVGLDNFTYTASDGAAVSNTATVVINVADANTPPVANDDSYATPYNAKLSVAAPGLLGNDRDADGNQPLAVVIATQPTKGTLALGVGGGFEYTPTGGVCAADSTDSFSYYANDGVVNSNLATVTVTLHCTNQAPVASADSYSIGQGGHLTIPAPGVLVNDRDPDGNPLRLVLVASTTKGPLASNADGSFTYVAPNTAGTDSFTYKATDGALESAVTTATITITATNQAPLAASDSYRTTKNVSLQVSQPGVLGNDHDPDGNLLTLGTVLSQPTNGSLSINPDGSFSYRPNANFVGLDSFVYTASDGTAVSAAASVTIEVADANTAPVAANDSYSTPAGVKLAVKGSGLLGNDHDPDGNQPLHVVLASQPTNGTLMLTAGGGFEYTPKSDAICSTDKTDKFRYYANDGVVNSNEATVHITIHCTNQAPLANADSYSVQQGATLNLPAPGVMVNDQDPDGNPITATIVSYPTLGALAFNPNGSFTYRAVTAGADSFTYKVSDGALESAVATVSINVTATNQLPLAGNDSYTTTKNVTLSVPAPGVLANDIDPDGNTLALGSVMAQPTHGRLHMNLDGSFQYSPDANYAGLDNFTYTASDGAGVSNAATVVLDIRDSNTAPGAANDSYTTPHNTRLVVGAPGLLANDSDPDGNQPLRVVIASQPTKGTLGLGVGGGFTYTPAGGVCSADSTDSFTYYANDSVVNSNLATATITLHCVNRAPVANAGSYSVQQGLTLDVRKPGVLSNDTDVDGNTLTATLVTPPASGTLSFHPNGGFSYTATTVGTQTFTYRANDGALDSAPATVTLNVTASPTYRIGGTVSGLTNGSALGISSGTDVLLLHQDGAFTFNGRLATGSAYNVSVSTQPAGHTCTVTRGTGTTGSADITDVSVTCTTNPGLTFVGSLPAGAGTANMSLSGGGGTCRLVSAQFISPVSLPPGYTMPLGVLDFETAGCSLSSQVTVRITYPSALPAGTVLWKFGPTRTNTTPHWYQHPATISGNTVTYTVVDGQDGDDDLSVNGAIIDPAGPGVPIAGGGPAQAITTLSERGIMLLAGLMVLSAFVTLRKRIT